ncbi:MAG: hypothetical protein E7645_08010 [Ruminococcaceae bacterium]|nr:hypothetical protein [Oscillospiraceae bacterium]
MRTLKKLTALMLAAFMIFSMIACDSGKAPADTQETNAPATDAPTDTPTAAPTDAPEVTDAPTESPTEAPTEAETQPPEPQLLTHVSFDDVVKAGLDMNNYILRPHQTSREMVQDGDAMVLALTASKATDAASSDPYIHINYEKLAKDMGGLMVDTQEYAYLVLRVKAADLWARTFSLYAYPTVRVQGEGAIGEKTAYIKKTDDWQYIYFDLGGANKPLTAFRFDYVNASLKEDTVKISDMYFCKTEEEALAMTGTDTYPIVDQTMDNYNLKIMSFNVQTENGTSVRMDIRADMLRALIDEYMPDSIGMQEVTARWRGLMDSYIFNDSYTGVGVARTDNPALGLEQSCIFYRSDKYDLLDSGTFWLSDTPDVVGSVFEGSQYPRICTYVHLKDKVTGFEYIHMNTHLDHLGGSDGRALRLKQETVMLQKLATLPKVATVITGDFNQLAFNGEGKAYAVYKLMTGERAFKLPDGTEMTMNLADSRMHAPENMPEGFTATMTTYHDVNSSKYMPSRYPIDYCFYTPDKLEALSYAIRLYDRDGIYLSDHLPVITSFRVIPMAEE